MSYRTNLFRKDNPGWPISNAAETIKVPGTAFHVVTAIGGPVTGIPAIAGRVRSTCGVCISFLRGLPRRAGRRWYQINDAEAGWRGWQVTERCGGLAREYRDTRFDALRLDPSLPRDECPCPGAGDLS